MRLAVIYCLLAAVHGSALGQNPSPNLAPVPALPKEPAEIFAAAAPLYDFASVKKPWHMKVSYQLYDEKNQPSTQGTYEYWWASPDTYRSTWKRPGVEHTDWHIQGKHASTATGASPEFFEWRLQSDLLSPLPRVEDLDPAKVRFVRQEEKLGAARLPCVMVIRKMPLNGQVQTFPVGMFPTYCFENQQPVLRAYFAFGATSVTYNKIAGMQGMCLPRELAIFDGPRKVLTASIDTVDFISPTAPELTPPLDSTISSDAETVQIPSGISHGYLIKQIPPHYPQEAKDSRTEGTVVLRALIGRDGHIHDLTVIEGPSPSLIGSAMWAVSQWVYKPYLLNGRPVEVDTTIHVIFNLGG